MFFVLDFKKSHSGDSRQNNWILKNQNFSAEAKPDDIPPPPLFFLSLSSSSILVLPKKFTESKVYLNGIRREDISVDETEFRREVLSCFDISLGEYIFFPLS